MKASLVSCAVLFAWAVNSWADLQAKQQLGQLGLFGTGFRNMASTINERYSSGYQDHSGAVRALEADRKRVWSIQVPVDRLNARLRTAAARQSATVSTCFTHG
jgi:hypothetical protein